MNLKPRLTLTKEIKDKIIIAAYIVAGIVIIGITYRIVDYIKLKRVTEQQAILNVAVINTTPEIAPEKIILPGNVQAWHEATIYARANGYLVNWMVDIGARVKTGDLLAEITAPEVVAQLRQTEADLKTAEANYNLAHTTAKRWRLLSKTDSVSKQETDEKTSDEKAKAAIVAATQAQRDRLRDLVSYQRIIAPFDGIITSRTTDIGRLINAGNGTVPLFRLAQEDHLRIYVRVPEYFAKNITSDIITELYFTEHPGKMYPAKLLNTADAIDMKTRTLLVQLDVDNANYELLAGSYTQVHFTLPANKKIMRLPTNTLIFRAQGLQIATISHDNKTLLKSITAGRDFGNTIEVVAGLLPGEKVILNPPDSLISGQKVKVVSSYSIT